MASPRKRNEAEVAVDLDTWANVLVTTAPDAVAEMRTIAKRLSEDSRLSTEDRAFAKSQLAAIQRAVRRNQKSAENPKQTIE